MTECVTCGNGRVYRKGTCRPCYRRRNRPIVDSDPDIPTDAEPGSLEKMEVLERRVAAWVSLHHPLDRIMGKGWGQRESYSLSLKPAQFRLLSDLIAAEAVRCEDHWMERRASQIRELQKQVWCAAGCEIEDEPPTVAWGDGTAA